LRDVRTVPEEDEEEIEAAEEVVADTMLAVEVVAMEETMQVAEKLESLSYDSQTTWKSMRRMINRHSEAVVVADATAHVSELVVARERDA
jgi:tRNA A58 N-methylase Trm61